MSSTSDAAGQAAADGPFSDDDLRHALRAGKLRRTSRVRLAGTDVAAPIGAWAALAPGRTLTDLPVVREPIDLPHELASAPAGVLDVLLWCLHEAGQTHGPMTGEHIRRGIERGRHATALAALVDTEQWFPAPRLFARTSAESSVAADHEEWPRSHRDTWTQCEACLEAIPMGVDACPECDEPRRARAPVSAAQSNAVPSNEGSWLSQHWRPMVTLGAMASLVLSGIALRYLAPGRFMPPHASSRPAAVAPSCASACWAGESCQQGQCVWQTPTNVGHVAPAASVSGPYALAKDVSDALPLDEERFAVALITGTEIHNARTGEVLSLVSDAPLSRKLYRVGEVIYAASPQRIYVIDASRTRVQKTIEVGSLVGNLAVGASGRRALASLPQSHAVAILATEYHAEIDRIFFGDDLVGPVGTDDTGKRALTTTGQIPLPGLRDVQGGAVYAFDPSRLASTQDRVRAAMLGNPVSVLMTPDGEESFVALRAMNTMVPLTWLPSGAVRQETRIPTCREPEQIELVRKGRRALVRCNQGRAVEVFDLATRQVVRHIAFNARAVDLAVSPDGRQAVVALPNEGSGAVALVDLDTYEFRLIPLGAEPTRVRLSPDGATLLALSDRSKVAWVVR